DPQRLELGVRRRRARERNEPDLFQRLATCGDARGESVVVPPRSGPRSRESQGLPGVVLRSRPRCPGGSRDERLAPMRTNVVRLDAPAGEDDGAAEELALEAALHDGDLGTVVAVAEKDERRRGARRNDDALGVEIEDHATT